MSLSEYLGMFEAAERPSQPSQSSLIKMGVNNLQRLLNTLGERLTADGKFGPSTKAAWARQATKRNQIPAFDRASATEAWISASTYTALSNAAVLPRTPAAVAPLRPVATSTARRAAAATIAARAPTPPVPAGTIQMSVSNLQTLLKSLGERLVADGKFGPATKAAWARQATKLGLSPTFVRVDPTNALVVSATYTALSAKATMPPAVARAAAIAPARAAAAAPARAGLIQMSVSNLQTLLKSLGERLVADGKFGPATKAAWGRQAAKLRMNATFDRVSPTDAKVSSETYTALSRVATLLPTVAATKAPAVVAARAAAVTTSNNAGAVTKSVLELQQLMQKLGWRGKADGSYGPQTAKAWAQYATARRLSPVISRIDGRTAKVSADAFTKLSSVTPAATQAPVVPPKPARMSAVAKAYIKGSTVRVSTEVVQQALAQSVKIKRLPVAPPAVTGVWNDETTALFLKILFTGSPNLAGATEALPSLIAADGKSIMLMPVYADALAAVSAQWLQQQRAASAQAPAPVPSEGPMVGTPGSYPTGVMRDQLDQRAQAQSQQAPEVVSGPTATSQPDPSTYESGPGPGPTPSQEAPSQEAPTPAPEPAPAVASGEAWGTLVNALANMTAVAPKFEAALEAAKEQGQLHPSVVEVYARWLASADVLKSRIADMLSKSPELRSAVDAVGPSAGLSGYDGSELSAYLGQLEAASDRAVELLREPFAPLGLSGLSGLGVGPLLVAGAEAAAATGAGAAVVAGGARVAALAARLGAPLWAKLLEILRLPVVQVAATGYMVKEAVGDAINGETAEYLQHEQALAELVANGTLTIDQYNQLKKPIPKQSSIVGPIVLGVVALGGLALYLKSRASS